MKRAYESLTPEQRAVVDTAALRLLEVEASRRPDRLMEMGMHYAQLVREWKPELTDAELKIQVERFAAAVVDRLQEIVAAGGDKGGIA